MQYVNLNASSVKGTYNLSTQLLSLLKNKKIAILGDSPLEYDARVQRIIRSFEEKGFNIDVFIPDVDKTELNLFNDKVKFYY